MKAVLLQYSNYIILIYFPGKLGELFPNDFMHSLKEEVNHLEYIYIWNKEKEIMIQI